MTALLEATELAYAVAGRNLVRDASVALSAGEFTVMIGPNGAGKSTLLKLLTGELKPNAGQVRYGSVPVGRLPAWRLACQRAVMAQSGRLAFPFTVHDVVRLGVDGIGRALDQASRHRMVAACLAASDIGHVAARSFQSLSGGEQQRVQFARVLCQLQAGRSVASEQLLFLDEPIASLDLCHQFALLDTARSVAAQGVAVLAVLHDINLAITYADRLIVLDGGCIVADGPPATIVTETLLSTVFNVSLPVGHMKGLPFILPQGRVSGPDNGVAGEGRLTA